MGKTSLIILIVTSFFFIGLQNSDAASNVCAGQGGVNCSAGPSLYGYAQCNNNTASSVLYSQLSDECATDEVTGCVSPRLSGCISRPQLQTIQNRLDEYIYKCQLSKGRVGDIYADCMNFSLQRQLQICQSELQEYDIQQGIYNSCIRNYYKTILSNTSLTYNLQKQKEEKECLMKYGRTWDVKNKVCVATDLFCTSSFGPNSHVVNSSEGKISCLCNDGFVMNSANARCVKKTASVAAAQNLNVNLNLGSSGSNVVTLQIFLENNGFLKIPTGTNRGYFGQLTKKAVADFQKSAGLPATGYCGPLTRTAINNSR